MKPLSVSIWRIGASLCMSMARVMAASSALLMVWRSSCDLILMCVLMPVLGLTTDAHSVASPDFFEPSVYIKFVGSHAARSGLRESFFFFFFWGGYVGLFMGGYFIV